MRNFNFKTVAYKGSKRKLVSTIVELAKETSPARVFDGFSGTGIVSAALRTSGFEVVANDLNISSFIYGSVFLNGYEPANIAMHLDNMNQIEPRPDWLTNNYSGTVVRKIRGTGGMMANRPLGLTRDNAAKIDAARNYIEEIKGLTPQDKNALIFSVIRACDGVFNNSNDQKSALKEWSKKSLAPVKFEAPTLIEGPQGIQLKGDIFHLNVPPCDFVYFDPPYTHGVLYASCYHLNNSLAIWDKPALDGSYAIPRPQRAKFRGKTPGAFYSKKTIQDDFDRLLSKYKSRRIVLSYSDAPRNCITISELTKICNKHGKVKVIDIDHKICTQYKTQNKISNNLKEFFIIIDN